MVCQKEPWHFHALVAIWITDSDKAACCLWFRFLFALKRRLSRMKYAYKIESKGRKTGGWSRCKWIYMSIPHCFTLMYVCHGTSGLWNTWACCNDQLTMLLQLCRSCICFPLAMACPSGCPGTSWMGSSAGVAHSPQTARKSGNHFTNINVVIPTSVTIWERILVFFLISVKSSFP